MMSNILNRSGAEVDKVAVLVLHADLAVVPAQELRDGESPTLSENDGDGLVIDGDGVQHVRTSFLGALCAHRALCYWGRKKKAEASFMGTIR